MYLAVGAGKDQSLLAIVEANQERWLTVRSPHLHHVTHAVGAADNAAVHAQPITDTRSHDDHLAGWTIGYRGTRFRR